MKTKITDAIQKILSKAERTFFARVFRARFSREFSAKILSPKDPFSNCFWEFSCLLSAQLVKQNYCSIDQKMCEEVRLPLVLFRLKMKLFDKTETFLRSTLSIRPLPDLYKIAFYRDFAKGWESWSSTLLQCSWSAKRICSCDHRRAQWSHRVMGRPEPEPESRLKSRPEVRPVRLNGLNVKSLETRAE